MIFELLSQGSTISTCKSAGLELIALCWLAFQLERGQGPPSQPERLLG